MAAIANHVQSAISAAVNPITGAVADAIAALSPTFDWRASSGYYVDGAVRIGYVPAGVANNWLAITDSALGSATSGWSRTAVACIDTDTTQNQCLASRAAAANYEWQLTWDRSTGFVTLTCYTLNAASSITATSAVAVAIGTPFVVCWGYDNTASKCSISVNAETPVVSSGTLTMATGTAADKLGSWFLSDLHFNGRIDSYGVSIGSQWCLTNRTALYNSGTFCRYQDLTTPTLTEWWDFGNATVFVSDYTNWDWLKGSVAGKMLTQAGSASDYPYLVRGLVAPLSTSDSTLTVLGCVDSTSNANHGIQPFFRCKPSFSATAGPDGGPAFYLPGVEYFDVQSVNGHALYSYDAGPSFTGTNQPYWLAMSFKIVDRDNPYHTTPIPGNVFGQSMCGVGNAGSVPWRAWGNSISSTPVRNSVFYRTEDATVDAVCNRLTIQRQDDAAKLAYAYDTYRGRLGTGWHTLLLYFNGTTHATYIDGVSVLSATQTADTDDTTPLGVQTMRAVALGHVPCGDHYGFPPTYQFTGSGLGPYMYSARISGKANATLTAGDIAAIHAQLLASPTSQVGTAWEVPAVTATHWLDAANILGFTSRTVSTNSVRIIADGDAVGQWLSRYNASKIWVASSDAKRPLYKTNIQNGRGVVRFDGTDDSLGASITLAQPFAIYFASKFVTVPTSERYLFSNSSSIWLGAGAFGTGTWHMYAGSTINWADANQGTFEVLCAVFNGASSKFYRGLTLTKTGNPGTGGLSGTMFLGSYNGSANYGNLDLGDMVIVAGATDVDSGEYTRLKNKWGTA